MTEELTGWKGTDFYLQDRSRLNGQPKRTIGDYAASKGILVPRRFETFEEAIKFKGRALARSEHLQDYDGGSGIFESPAIGKNTNLWFQEDLFSKSTSESQAQPNFVKSYKTYCQFAGLSIPEFTQGLSFSFWERLPGINVSIVADSAIEGRYHIRANHTLTRKWRSGYTLFENGTPTPLGGIPSPGTFSRVIGAQAERLTEFYENVKRLDHFDPNHCPIIEAQIYLGDIYFLQYHRCRDFAPVNFSVTPPGGKRHAKISNIRGATPPDGLVLDTIVVQSLELARTSFIDHSLKTEADLGEFFLPKMLREFMSRKWKLYLSQTEAWKVFGHLSCGHLGMSLMHKPQVSGLFEGDLSNDLMSRLFTYSEIEAMEEASREQKTHQHAKLRVVSDGRNGYLERV